MIATGMTIKEATQEWVKGFNDIPQSLLEKLAKNNPDEFHEITPPSRCDRVYIYNGEHEGDHGEIVRISDDDDVYVVELDADYKKVEVKEENFEVERDDYFPMWGTMWTFGERIDEWWLEDKVGLQKMADCGFRIYEQEDLGFVFGIDGAGYDFYEAHWIPLYRARGLQWHDETTENKEDAQ